jgi:transcription-repair coupling factor (superfamily II helicase)
MENKMLHQPFQPIIDQLRSSGHHSVVYNATFDASVYMAIESFRQTKKTTFVVAPNLYYAQKAFDAIQNTIGEEQSGFFPADELISAELLAASFDFKVARIQTLVKLLNDQPMIVVMNLNGWIRKIRPVSRWKEATIDIHKRHSMKRQDLEKALHLLGYQKEHAVEQRGQYAVRGYVLDFFSIQMQAPVRIEFFDDDIESIKVFDPLTQQSKEEIEELSILPFNETLFDFEDIQSVIQVLENGEENPTKQAAIERLLNTTQDDSFYRYICFTSHESILSFATRPHIIMIDTNRINDIYMNMINDVNDWFISQNHYQDVSFEFFNYLEQMEIKTTHLTQTYLYKPDIDGVFMLDLNSIEVLDYINQTDLFFRDVQNAKETIILQKDKAFMSLLEHREIPYRLISNSREVVPGALHVLAEHNSLAFTIVGSYSYIPSSKVFQTQQRKARYQIEDAVPIRSTADISEGDYVVHYEYGIGQYLGITTLDLDGFKNDYILIAYRNDEKLYVPIENIHLIQRYQSSAGATPKLHSIGGGVWAKTKRQVQAKLKDIADRLIALYAERQQTPGYAFAKDDPDQAMMEALFEHEETSDQIRAIEEVKYDMEQPFPMDRLLCGDVGYGKTEVAIRAAFKAVYSGKQVAYMCPTTILSSQHYKTFTERFRSFGIEVALLNRFVSTKEQKRVIQGLAEGQIDVVIGTHRLLSKDITFRQLGLLIVDEEQRFGVMHKERIKELSVNIDILTMTATPIPRTLQMALTGVKHTSLLETPPANRYPVQTYVMEYNERIIRDAIERELSRGGQIFILHNRVSDITLMAQKIQRLVPEARVVYAHGQMSKEKLEKTMQAYVEHQYDCLIATTIIETGLDIPNANTLIILQADLLGLAQLYQIRGRVGRSDKIAYAYLMFQDSAMTPEAEKRLQAIKEFTELGSGFKIAMRDLSIRGAGDILGREQSGFIDSVGFDLYMQMLEEELAEQQGRPLSKPTERKQSSIKVQKHIPDEYTSNPETKIMIHRKIGELSSSEDYLKLLDELKDQFGYVPDSLKEFMQKILFDQFIVELHSDQIQEAGTSIRIRIDREFSEQLLAEDIMQSLPQDSPIQPMYRLNRWMFEGPSQLESWNHFLEPLTQKIKQGN